MYASFLTWIGEIADLRERLRRAELYDFASKQKLDVTLEEDALKEQCYDILKAKLKEQGIKHKDNYGDVWRKYRNLTIEN